MSIANSDALEALIIGQGIAGSVLSEYIRAYTTQFKVIDKGNEKSASAIAAGIVNPVTGKRFVMSWKFEELNKEALSFYENQELNLGIQIIEKTPIFRVLYDPALVNAWDSKIALSEYNKYLSESADIGSYKNLIAPQYFVGQTNGSYRIRTRRFLRAIRNNLITCGQFIEGELDESELIEEGEYWKYRNVRYKRIIYANGASAADSIFWNYLPFNISKGGALTMKDLKYPLKGMLKYKLFFVPLGSHKIWIGSSNSWDYTTAEPAPDTINFLTHTLRSTFGIIPENVYHMAALRPTVYDRRPLIGEHPISKCIYIFNGMGTKGVSLSPLLARQFADMLFNNGSIFSEAHIHRFRQ